MDARNTTKGPTHASPLHPCPFFHPCPRVPPRLCSPAPLRSFVPGRRPIAPTRAPRMCDVGRREGETEEGGERKRRGGGEVEEEGWRGRGVDTRGREEAADAAASAQAPLTRSAREGKGTRVSRRGGGGGDGRGSGARTRGGRTGHDHQWVDETRMDRWRDVPHASYERKKKKRMDTETEHALLPPYGRGETGGEACAQAVRQDGEGKMGESNRTRMGGERGI